MPAPTKETDLEVCEKDGHVEADVLGGSVEALGELHVVDPALVVRLHALHQEVYVLRRVHLKSGKLLRDNRTTFTKKIPRPF